VVFTIPLIPFLGNRDNHGFSKLQEFLRKYFRATPEEEYTKELGEILPLCSAAYFVVCEHKDRWSPGWDNDKLLVLVKA
jgi:hypothetical protein